MLEIGEGNGPWTNPEQLRKLNGILRYAHGDDKNGLTLTAMAYASHWNSTDQIPLRAVQSGQLGRFDAVDATDGGRTSRYSLSTQWVKGDASSSTRANAYVIHSRLNLLLELHILPERSGRWRPERAGRPPHGKRGRAVSRLAHSVDRARRRAHGGLA